MHKEYRLYNILLPVWMLIWFPSFLWLFLIPGNYLIDLLVTRIAMKKSSVPDYGKKALQHAWKICIAGFIADFAGAAVLLGFVIMDVSVQNQFFHEVINNLSINPFLNPVSLLITVLAILLSGILIYFIDRAILRRDPGLNAGQAHRIALWLAVLTAPYLYLIPMTLIYH